MAKTNTRIIVNSNINSHADSARVKEKKPSIPMRLQPVVKKKKQINYQFPPGVSPWKETKEPNTKPSIPTRL